MTIGTVDTSDLLQLKSGGVIKRQSDEYRVIMGEPRKVGDVTEIELLPVVFGKSRRFVRVMLREAMDGSLWLVQIKDMEFHWP